MSTPDLERMIERLAAMDRRSTLGPWTLQSLEVIQRRPGRRAPEFAELLGREAQPWKAQLRRLKEFGLTASPPVGYRLSPRGDQVLTAARRRRPRQPVI